jgi:ABC-type transport system involved in cytochrome bd biosynthesis fused ATPase/permease subunit
VPPTIGSSLLLASGGQRQRIALTRTLLVGFPILIADEPAAHLDDETADGLTADLLSV